MKFDPKTKALYTDAGEFLKVLHCPLRQRWEQLGVRSASPHRHCDQCEKTVLDTSTYTDGELRSAIRDSPAICLSVSARQPNVTILQKFGAQ
jgi:hypothetical protein